MNTNLIVAQRYEDRYVVYQYYLDCVGEAVVVAIDSNNAGRVAAHVERLCDSDRCEVSRKASDEVARKAAEERGVEARERLCMEKEEHAEKCACNAPLKLASAPAWRKRSIQKRRACVLLKT